MIPFNSFDLTVCTIVHVRQLVSLLDATVTAGSLMHVDCVQHLQSFWTPGTFAFISYMTLKPDDICKCVPQLHIETFIVPLANAEIFVHQIQKE
jgi:hypothetical protein